MMNETKVAIVTKANSVSKLLSIVYDILKSALDNSDIKDYEFSITDVIQNTNNENYNDPEEEYTVYITLRSKNIDEFTKYILKVL